MSAAERRWRSCERKVKYPTKAVANKVLLRRMLGGAPRLKCYRCRHCGGWHLTNLRKRVYGDAGA